MKTWDIAPKKKLYLKRSKGNKTIERLFNDASFVVLGPAGTGERCKCNVVCTLTSSAEQWYYSS